MGPGQRWDEALAANKWYVLIVVLCVYWAATLLNLRGMKTSAGVTNGEPSSEPLFPEPS